ncbi:Uncharacterised protein [Candidatus Tiddalikarchaeum anstoanum]|nr:Uncharacterised protein [Candidatus Tiddalikarchaeum anstoanum]
MNKIGQECLEGLVTGGAAVGIPIIGAGLADNFARNLSPHNYVAQAELGLVSPDKIAFTGSYPHNAVVENTYYFDTTKTFQLNNITQKYNPLVINNPNIDNSGALIGQYSNGAWATSNDPNLTLSNLSDKNLGFHSPECIQDVVTHGEPVANASFGAQGFWSGAGTFAGINLLFDGIKNYKAGNKKAGAIEIGAGAGITGISTIPTAVSLAEQNTIYASSAYNTTKILAAKNMSLLGGSFMQGLGSGFLGSAVFDALKFFWDWGKKGEKNPDHLVKAGCKAVAGASLLNYGSSLANLGTATWYANSVGLSGTTLLNGATMVNGGYLYSSTIYTCGLTNAVAATTTALGGLALGLGVALGIYAIYKIAKYFYKKRHDNGQVNQQGNGQQGNQQLQGPPQNQQGNQNQNQQLQNQNNQNQNQQLQNQNNQNQNQNQNQQNQNQQLQINIPPVSYHVFNKFLLSDMIEDLVTERSNYKANLHHLKYHFNTVNNQPCYEWNDNNINRTLTKQDIQNVLVKAQNQALTPDEEALRDAFYLSFKINNYNKYKNFLNTIFNTDIHQLPFTSAAVNNPGLENYLTGNNFTLLLGELSNRNNAQLLTPLLNGGGIQANALWDNHNTGEVESQELIKYLLLRQSYERAVAELKVVQGAVRVEDIMYYFVKYNTEKGGLFDTSKTPTFKRIDYAKAHNYSQNAPINNVGDVTSGIDKLFNLDLLASLFNKSTVQNNVPNNDSSYAARLIANVRANTKIHSINANSKFKKIYNAI